MADLIILPQNVSKISRTVLSTHLTNKAISVKCTMVLKAYRYLISNHPSQ